VGENKQVLVADDEDNLRRVLKAQLQRDGYEVHCVADGEAVLEAMAEHHIDVLITDLRMPKLDGMEVLKSVSGRFPNVPVIMITAHGTVDTAVEALKLGAFDYVTKPFDRAEFRTVVGKAIRTRELSQEHVSGEGSSASPRLCGWSTTSSKRSRTRPARSSSLAKAAPARS
jgi:DNA-binding NtrC family response regulator